MEILDLCTWGSKQQWQWSCLGSDGRNSHSAGESHWNLVSKEFPRTSQRPCQAQWQPMRRHRGYLFLVKKRLLMHMLKAPADKTAWPWEGHVAHIRMTPWMGGVTVVGTADINLFSFVHRGSSSFEMQATQAKRCWKCHEWNINYLHTEPRMFSYYSSQYSPATVRLYYSVSLFSSTWLLSSPSHLFPTFVIINQMDSRVGHP